ncbi:MAG: LAS superfamily LD-carboxypeptidase LdcB [Psychromonas sp.]|jgi:LAS superfamily LD-carboxypeptidase LdcB|uniref:M15 family metallopeptidase n=1 Tax=Psychromonas sp. TaxID=1884585 RepID=UPI0039E4C5D2
MLAEQLTGQVFSHLTQLSNNIYVHKEVVGAFNGLQMAAQKAGFNLQIASGFRSFERQQLIWNNKFSDKTPILDKNGVPLAVEKLSESEKLFAILHWSALPGTSRHHWGTDFDFFDPDCLPAGKNLQLTVSEYSEAGYFFELTQWLSENMKSFGFYRPYQKYNGGVAIEPWHLSYFPIAQQAIDKLTLPLIEATISANNVLAKSLICEQLPIIYKQFICNIETP